MPPSVVLYVRLCSGGKICNLCIIIIDINYYFAGTELGSSVARVGRRLGGFKERPVSYACHSTVGLTASSCFV